MKKTFACLLMAMILMPFGLKAQDTITPPTIVKKVLVIGDSMTGWIGERLGAYGQENGFEVATVIWDGSTINKWAKSPRLKKLIKEQNPDLIVVSLGMNELFEANPENRLGHSLNTILAAFGDIPYVWIGPPSWPGKMKQGPNKLDQWFANRLGEHYFSSINLSIERQSKTNPHPTKNGTMKWIDQLAEWMPSHIDVQFPSLNKPSGVQMKRGKVFIYKKMKETL